MRRTALRCPGFLGFGDPGSIRQGREGNQVFVSTEKALDKETAVHVAAALFVSVDALKDAICRTRGGRGEMAAKRLRVKPEDLEAALLDDYSGRPTPLMRGNTTPAQQTKRDRLRKETLPTHDIPAALRRVLAGELKAPQRTVQVSELVLRDTEPALADAEDYLARDRQGLGGRFPVVNVHGVGYVPLMFDGLLAGLQQMNPELRVRVVEIPVDPDGPDGSVYDPWHTREAFGCQPKPE